MRIFCILLLVVSSSCAQWSRPKGPKSYFVGTSTEYDAKTNQVIRDADIMLETVIVNEAQEIHAWFYTAPSSGVKLEIFPSISKRTENPLYYVMTNRDGSYLGKHFFYSEKRDKWRVELYDSNGEVNIVDYSMNQGQMELVQNISRLDGTPLKRITGKMTAADEAQFKAKLSEMEKVK